MIRKRIVLLSLVTIFLIIASVSATTKQEYYDNTPFPVYGSWEAKKLKRLTTVVPIN